MDHILEIKNLSIEFGAKEETLVAVKNFNLKIARGATVGLVGESGSGKSVTSLSIMGLIPNPPGKVVSGEILFNGSDLLKYKPQEMRKIRGDRISMIFQEPMTSLNPVFTVGDQIDETLILHHKLSQKDARKRTLELFDEVGIADGKRRVKDYPHHLSGGQKQRIMIAMAIACEPELLICDEPTTALDVTIQKQVLELMFDLQKKHGMSILFITHDLGVIADIADTVAVMYRGKLIEYNTCKNIFKNPQHPYTKGLLACRPRLDHNPERLLTVKDFMNNAGEEITPKLDQEKIKACKEEDHIKYPILLEVQHLKKYFPIKGGIFRKVIDEFKAVDDINFTLRRGRTLGLVGESGCGKTTLGRTILRLLPLTGGRVIYDGIDLHRLNNREMRNLRRKMQIIFQDPYSSLNPRMNIAKIIMEPMIIHGIGKDYEERLFMVEELLKKVGMNGDYLQRYPHEFSGGQRQRICIARVLSVQPEFIICDESVSALDVSVQAQVLNLLMDLQNEFNLTYIFISHDLSVVKYMSDEIGVMESGRMIEYAPAEEIYKNPKQQYTRDLLEAIPKGIPKELLL